MSCVVHRKYSNPVGREGSRRRGGYVAGLLTLLLTVSSPAMAAPLEPASPSPEPTASATATATATETPLPPEAPPQEPAPSEVTSEPSPTPTETMVADSPVGTAEVAPETSAVPETSTAPADSDPLTLEELTEAQLNAEPGAFAELLGTLDARLGQGLDRLLETGDATIPTADEENLETATASDGPFSASASDFQSTVNYWQPSSGVLGVDVASHQGEKVNWSGAYSYGSRFAYVKATEGTYYKNPYYGTQSKDAAAAGMLRGAYHFAIPNLTSGAAQADYFINNGGTWTADGKTLPPLLDIEYNPYDAETMPSGKGDICYGLSDAQMITWIRSFSDRMLARTGRLPMIYTTTDWWQTCTGNTGAFAKNPLHIARYSNSGPGTLPNGWSTYSLWQYTSTGPVVGDWNQWPGTLTNLRNFAANRPSTDQTQLRFSTADFNGDGRTDLMDRRSDGTLWLSRGLSGNRYASPVRIGTGWNIFDRVFAVDDFDNDGFNDLAARTMGGELWLYSGNGTGGFRKSTRIGSGGWLTFNTVIGVGDATRDGFDDIAGRDASGYLYIYPGSGTGGFKPRIGAGGGWQGRDSLDGRTDYTGDGIPDMISRDASGYVRLHPGTGTGTFAASSVVGSGWGSFTNVLAGQDVNQDGKPDLIARFANGNLRTYLGNGTGGYLYETKIGRAWNFTTVFEGTDFDGDGNRDVIALATDGTLLLYSGNGSGGFKAKRTIGVGWNIFESILNGRDFDGDGKPDVIGRTRDGALLLYTTDGTGKFTSKKQIGRGWASFEDVLGVGDFDGDNKSDLMARTTTGYLLLYPGNGGGTFKPKQSIGRGWAAFDLVTAADDFGQDGTQDLLARTPTGEAFLYSGNGTGGWKPRTGLGTGWERFADIASTGDFTKGGRPNLVLRQPNGELFLRTGNYKGGLGLITVNSGAL